jgi:uncharacterized protein (DUF1330 family)
MTAYVIADVDVLDAERFAEYRERAPAVLDLHGVRYVARGGTIEVLEGDWRPTRLVILAFDDIDHARRWYASPEYQELKALRADCSTTSLVVVEGVDADAG